MNPQTTINYLTATADIARSDRRAERGWQAAEASALRPRTPFAGQGGIVGMLVAVLAAVAGLVR
jgi:hypothetical protein